MGPRARWSDHTLLQLLKLYMQKALNPFERPPVGMPRSKAVYRKNAPPEGDLYQSSHIKLDNGDKVFLKNFTSHDNMLAQLSWKQLSGQTFGQGLVSIIDKYFEEKDLPRDKEHLKLEEDNIIEFAKQYMKDPS